MSADFQQLSEMFNLDQDIHSDISSQTPDHRVQEFQQMVEFKDQVSKENNISAINSQRTFGTLSVMFIIAAVLMGLSLIPGLGAVGSLTSAGMGMFIFSIIFGGIFAARKVFPTPIDAVKERADKVMNNVVLKKMNRSSVPKFIPKPRRRKVILGVGSFIAEKTDIAPEIVRLLLVILAFISGGTVIPAYIISGFIINAIRNNRNT